MGNLKGKVALVTGASRGIGRTIAVRLAADGATVAIHYGANADAARETLATIEQAGGRGFVLQADLNTPETSITTMFADFDRGLAECSGESGLDIVVNNAGQIMFGSVEVLKPSEFDNAFAVDVKAPFFITQAALPRLRNGGRVINISSATSRFVNPNVVSYAMSLSVRSIRARWAAAGPKDSLFAAVDGANCPNLPVGPGATALTVIPRAPS